MKAGGAERLIKTGLLPRARERFRTVRAPLNASSQGLDIMNLESDIRYFAEDPIISTVMAGSDRAAIGA
jgi:hypothetical protein